MTSLCDDAIVVLFACVFLCEFFTHVTCHVTAPVELAVALPALHVLVSIVSPATTQQITTIVIRARPVTHPSHGP